jgi:rhamnose utilization protein RhaD (predicted bifunctional aldolase and dehydrogenase)
MDYLNNLREEISNYCFKLGQNILLVQGAGGNVSWKEDGVLWVKASGTWLSDALNQDIFVPVDLESITFEVEKGNFDFQPKILEGLDFFSSDIKLRPSIETMIHGLMPQKIVVHLHPAQVLSHLICSSVNLREMIDKSINFGFVGYKKPGAELAFEINNLIKAKVCEVIFLQNHGLVIGAESVIEIDSILKKLIENLEADQLDKVANTEQVQIIKIDSKYEYNWILDESIQQLVFDLRLFERIESNWALYPDHVVFLGGTPFVFNDLNEFNKFAESSDRVLPEVVFIKSLGVFSLNKISKAKIQQLRCYYEVLSRVSNWNKVKTLTCEEISGLLNWDSEKYRLQKIR